MDKYLVFSDVDGTIINIKSMFSFLRYYWRQAYATHTVRSAIHYGYYLMKIHYAQLRGQSRITINEDYYKHFAQTLPKKIIEAGDNWWKSISNSKNLYNKSVLKELQEHKQKGAEIILVSGAMDACIKPLATELGADHCLLTKLEISQGKFTGKIVGGVNIGEGKKSRIQEFISQYRQPIDLKHCYAYGDHISDLPMLTMVGNPIVVGKDKPLIELAKYHNWKIIH